jgi:hypothetical protein
MSRTITPPTARIPIGTVLINGRSVDVQQHPEFVRFFFDLFARVGSTAALSNTELEAMAQALLDAGPQATSSVEAAEAMRAVDEVRNEIDSLRSSNQRLVGLVEQLAAQIEQGPSLQPFEQRITQIEDRLQ